MFTLWICHQACVELNDGLFTCNALYTLHPQLLIANLFSFNTVPQAPPQRLIANATNSRTLVLGWEAPDPDDRNGIIIKYTINITELDTDMPLDFVIGNTTTLTVSVHPFYRYSYIIAAETIIGLGPYSMPPQVFQMPEDGR